MLAIDTPVLGRNMSDEALVWDGMIGAVTHYRGISETFSSLVRREHDRRGHGKLPTLDTVRLVIEACEDEGIFGLGG